MRDLDLVMETLRKCVDEDRSYSEDAMLDAAVMADALEWLEKLVEERKQISEAIKKGIDGGVCRLLFDIPKE